MLIILRFFIFNSTLSRMTFSPFSYILVQEGGDFLNQIYTGTKIATLRKEKNMTQKDLAELLHVTDKAVSKWERGLNYPDLSLFPELAKALDTSVAELLGLDSTIPDSAIDVISKITKQEKRVLQNILKEYIILTVLLGIGLIFFKVYIYNFGYVYEMYNLIFWTEAILIGLSLTLITNGIRLLLKYKELF